MARISPEISSGYGSLSKPEKDVTVSSHSADQQPIPQTGMRWYWGSFIIINTVVAFGALTLPATAQTAGNTATWVSVMLLMFAVMLSSFIIMGYVQRENTNLPSYEAITLHYFNTRIAEGVVAFLTALYVFLSSIAYLIGIQEIIEILTKQYVPVAALDHWYVDKYFLLFLTSAVFILPLCLLPRIEQLKHASALASVCVFYTAGVTVATAVSPAKFLNPKLDAAPVASNVTAPWYYDLSLVSSCLFAFNLSFVGPAIYVKLCPKRFYNYGLTLTTAMCGVLVLYLTLVSSMLSATDRKLDPNLLLNLNVGHPAVAVAYFAYIIKLCFEYPVNAFVGRQAIVSFFENYSWSQKWWIKILISLTWYAFTMMFASVIPQLLIAVKFASLAVIFIVVHLPAVLLLKSLKKYPVSKKWDSISKVIAGVMLFVGSVVAVLIFITTMSEFATGNITPVHGHLPWNFTFDRN